MYGFFPGAFFFGPSLLFFGLLRIALLVLLIVLIVRLVSHGHRGADYMHDRGRGYGHAGGYDAQSTDPRRVAAWRYAAGQIDRAEFDHIMGGLDAASTSAPTAAPSNPTPPVA